MKGYELALFWLRKIFFEKNDPQRFTVTLNQLHFYLNTNRVHLGILGLYTYFYSFFFQFCIHVPTSTDNMPIVLK